MLLALTCRRSPATDLGFLLHKHPERVQSFELAFGKAHVFYPEAREDRCTAVLLLDVDPVGLVRRRGGRGGEAFPLADYVSDRPYVASSFLSVAIARVFGSALSGTCAAKPDLPATPLDLEAWVPVLPCRGGEGLARSLFEPLGYEVSAERHDLDALFPDWGAGSTVSLRLRGTKTLRELLSHLYVLVPVTDDAKHYFVGPDEVAKLLKHGEGWLADHPRREMITLRYLAHQRTLCRAALARLVSEEEADPDAEAEAQSREEASLEEPMSLADLRLEAVLAALLRRAPRRVVDLGCGEGRLLERLVRVKELEAIAGLDVCHRSLEIAARRLRLPRQPEKIRAKVALLHGSVTLRDDRLAGFDAAACVEVVEHIDPARLRFFERALFGHARPATVVLTTPNVEHNVRFPGLAAGTFRHRDHRFEWTRGEFREWAEAVAKRYGYAVGFEPVGTDDPEVGPPTQLGVFTR